MKKLTIIIIFIFSSIALLISIKLFWNIAIFVDKFNTSPSIVLGGDFWLYMEWLKIGLLLTITVLSAFHLFNLYKSNK